ncbi:hypothetical protein QTI24_28700 [Variovorax sp. J22P240]|uniref:hypothetical protein n=1 Tax=Variovorax sp. J22P240 TaxID=3053514 RepID=UPI0025767730|nr:hypothetical protein [Variovorax sp. J22P240]MDM0002614.1 hypothetical protein [Variovorax sp. J22P240]
MAYSPRMTRTFPSGGADTCTGKAPMTKTFTAEDRIRSAARGASAIYHHLSSDPACAGPWGFDRGRFDAR